MSIASDLQSQSPALLNSLLLVTFDGKDARDFLHRVLTQDVLHLGRRVATAAFCDPKGRMLALMRLWLSGEHAVKALLPVSGSEPILKRLRMFVLRDDVKITVAPAESVLKVALLKEATATLAAHELPVPAAGEVARSADGSVEVLAIEPAAPAAQQIGGERAIVIAEAAAAARLAGFWEPQSDAAFWASEILAGVPAVFAETSGLFVPQQANLDLVGGVHFNKGCYPGQEVISRMKHIGRPSRRAYLATSATATPLPAPGTPVFAEGNEVGYVINAADLGETRFVLASLLIAETARPLALDKEGGDALTLATLPYSIE